MHGRGGPITAAVDGPGGPILAGDHRRRDSPTASKRPSRTLRSAFLPPLLLATPICATGVSSEICEIRLKDRKRSFPGSAKNNCCLGNWREQSGGITT